MEKKVIVKAEGLRKTFKLSKKQQNIQKTKEKAPLPKRCEKGQSPPVLVTHPLFCPRDFFAAQRGKHSD